MRKLDALVDFFIQKNLVAAENFETYVSIDEFMPVADYVNNGFQDGLCAYDQTYTAVINIENFPHKKYSTEFILSLVAVWLFNNDTLPFRRKIARDSNNGLIDLEPPSINIEKDLIETDVAMLEIMIPFREPVFWVEDEEGAFEYQDKIYRLADTSVENEQFEENYILGIS